MKYVEAHEIPNRFFNPIDDEVINVSDDTEEESKGMESAAPAAKKAEKKKNQSEPAAGKKPAPIVEKRSTRNANGKKN